MTYDTIETLHQIKYLQTFYNFTMTYGGLWYDIL